MEMREITLKLPADYVQDAEDFGMLDPEAMITALRKELDQRIMDFVNAEIKAYRAEEYAKSKNGQSTE